LATPWIQFTSAKLIDRIGRESGNVVGSAEGWSGVSQGSVAAREACVSP
jgi:hypothetical protein